MGFLRRHVGENGVVTNDALMKASKDHASAYHKTAKKWDDMGAHEAAAELRQKVDEELDWQNTLRKRGGC
ncbi:hypothetical protein [Streptomyces cacaoi]|uniref:hypothetical protein n=1 Tax=Streptomyces cacaoi TaxID=1898 RepID=UPI002605DD76|nr:hypothetical protein [Streptomyces cacaoi]